MNNNFNLCLSGRLFETSYSENTLTLEEFFRVAAENSFKGVEIRDSQAGIDSSSAVIDKVNMLTEKYGIPVALITARKGRLDNKEGYEVYKKYLTLAENLNCPQIKISGTNISLIKKAASDAEKSGIKTGTNNHLGTPAATAAGTLELFREVNHSNFYLHLDPSHLWLSREDYIDEFIEEIFPRISYVIIQDYVEHENGDLLGTRRVTPVSIGEHGLVGYPQVIKKLASMHYKEPFALVYLKDAISLNLHNCPIKEHILKYFQAE
jgi:sugar phosphate isomerase/epimerase